jgi:hypothetical protein
MAPKRIKEENQIFAQLAQVAKEIAPDWFSFYTSCSYGKLPPKVKVFERSLVFRRGPRPSIFPLPLEASPEELDRCNRFFREEVGLIIGQAAVQPVVESQPLIKRIQRLKKLRNIQLLLYTKMVAERDSLSTNQQEQLFSVIALGWLSGLLNTRSLVIEPDENGIERIVNIQGVQRDEAGNFFIYTPTITRTRTRNPVTQVSKPKNTLQDQWLVYTNRSKPAGNPRATATTDGDDSTSLTDW